MVDNNASREDLRVRQEAFVIPLDILQQKLYYKWGLLNIMLGKTQEAQDCFLKSVNIGSIYDARVRQICLQQLIALLIRQHKPVANLQTSLANFQHKNRDYIFLINRAAS